MIRFLFFLIALAPLLTTAQKPYDFKEAELESRKLVYSDPQSALVLIKKTLAQANRQNVHDTIKGNTYNLYGMYFGMTGNADSSIYYFKKSLGYVNKYPRNKARSLTNLAIGYRNKGSYKESAKYLNEALALHRKEGNQVGVAMAYGELASIHNYLLEYDKSVDYLLKAIKILKAENNTRQLVAVKQKLANTYLAQENFEFAADLYKECLPEFLAIGMEKNYYLTLVNLGESYIRLERFAEARTALQEASEGLEKFGDKELIGISYSKVANIEERTGQTDKAEVSYSKALDNLIATGSVRIVRIGGEYMNMLNENNRYYDALKVLNRIEPLGKYDIANIEDRMVYQIAKADTYAHTSNEKLGNEAFKKAIFIMDTLRATGTQEAVKEIQAQFQTELQREKNLALEAKNEVLQQSLETDRILLVLYIIIIAVLLILIFSFLRSYRLKSRLQEEELMRIETERNLIKQQHMHEQELTNAQREIIEEKQRELTSSALRMANYQDSINEIIEKCETNSYNSTNDIKKELIGASRQKDYWKQFETRFNTLHPDFGNTLVSRFSKLTKNDIEFCSLLKLNLSNKEIASLLQISHESAITKKYRIKKKMEIHDDSEFEKLLMEI